MSIREIVKKNVIVSAAKDPISGEFVDIHGAIDGLSGRPRRLREIRPVMENTNLV